MAIKRPSLTVIKRAALAEPDYDASNLADDLVDDVPEDDQYDIGATEQRFDVYYWTVARIREYRAKA